MSIPHPTQKPSWITPRRSRRPANLMLTMLWQSELLSNRLHLGRASHFFWSRREYIEEHSCYFCRRFDLLAFLPHQPQSQTADGPSGRLIHIGSGDYAHPACLARSAGEFSRHRYPVLYWDPVEISDLIP